MEHLQLLNVKVKAEHIIVFNLHGSVHSKNILIYIQQDARLHSLFISGNSSICFGWYFHPSSGTHTTYLQHLVFVTPLLLPATIVEELELV
jgi:hypothetical protein